MKDFDQKSLTAEERAKMLDEFIKKGGKVQKIPYGVTNQEMGEPNQNAGWNPPKTITPKTYKSRITKAKNKKKNTASKKKSK
jgi:hypothetical protein